MHFTHNANGSCGFDGWSPLASAEVLNTHRIPALLALEAASSPSASARIRAT